MFTCVTVKERPQQVGDSAAGEERRRKEERKRTSLKKGTEKRETVYSRKIESERVKSDSMPTNTNTRLEYSAAPLRTFDNPSDKSKFLALYGRVNSGDHRSPALRKRYEKSRLAQLSQSLHGLNERPSAFHGWQQTRNNQQQTEADQRREKVLQQSNTPSEKSEKHWTKERDTAKQKEASRSERLREVRAASVREKAPHRPLHPRLSSLSSLRGNEERKDSEDGAKLRLTNTLKGAQSTLVTPDTDEEDEQVQLRDRRPVQRRRRFKHRKSVNLEPDTGLILARGCSRSSASSSASDSDRKRDSSISSRNTASERAEDSSSSSEHETFCSTYRGPSARRAAARRHQLTSRKTRPQLAASLSHLASIGSSATPSKKASYSSLTRSERQTRSMSVTDLHGEQFDFTNPDAVTRWTSRMLAELDSLPGSRADLSATGERREWRLSTPLTLSPSSLPPPVPAHRMTHSMICTKPEELMTSTSTSSVGSYQSFHSTPTDLKMDSLYPSAQDSWHRSNSHHSLNSYEDFVTPCASPVKCGSLLSIQSQHILNEFDDLLRSYEEFSCRSTSITPTQEVRLQTAAPTIQEPSGEAECAVTVELSSPDRYARVIGLLDTRTPPPPAIASIIASKTGIREEREPPQPKNNSRDTGESDWLSIDSSTSRCSKNTLKSPEEVASRAASSTNDESALLKSISRLSKSVYGEIEKMMSGEEEPNLAKWKKTAECRHKTGLHGSIDRILTSTRVHDTSATAPLPSSRPPANASYRPTADSSIPPAPRVASEAPSLPPPAFSVDEVVSNLLRTAQHRTAAEAEFTTRDGKIGENSQNFGTQTSPQLSRSSSFDWLSEGVRHSLSSAASTPVSARVTSLHLSSPHSLGLQLTAEPHSSGEEAADTEVSRVNCAAEESSDDRRLGEKMDDNLEMLLQLAIDDQARKKQHPSHIPTHFSAADHPLSSCQRLHDDHFASRSEHREHNKAEPERLLKEKRSSANQPSSQPSTNARSSSTMSDSVYDNVHPSKSFEDKEENYLHVAETTICSMDAAQLMSDDDEKSSMKTSPDTLSSPSSASAIDPDRSLLQKLKRAEEDAVECCDWLNRSGFPQYTQAYLDGAFPLRLESVLSDHRDLLDSASINALSRRINALNRCTIMKIDHVLLRNRNSSMHTAQNMVLPSSIEDGIALSDRWRFEKSSHTWNRMNDHQRHQDSTSGSSLDASGDGSAIGCGNGNLSGSSEGGSTSRRVLQRTQSERIKDRAKALIRKMDMRTKQRKEDKALVIGDPVLQSYVSASPLSMRVLQNATSLPPYQSHSLASNGAAPNAVHYSTNNNNGNFAPKFLPETKTRRQPYGRSASSSRRQGVVFTSLSSPDSSDESSPLVARLSRFGEPSPARSLGQRDRSAPSKQRNYVGSGGPPVSSMLLRREVPSAAEYLFPNRVSLSRISTPTPSFTTPPAPSSSSSPFSVRAAPFMTPPLERRLFSANYRTHAAEASPSNSLARHRQGTQMNSAPRHTSHPYHNGETQIDSQTYQDVGISAAPFFLASPLLNVETLAVSDDERSPGRLEGCAHRRDSGVGSSLSRSPSAPSTLRLRQSMLTPPSPLSSSFSSSTSSSTASWPNHHIHSSTGGSIIDVVVSGRKRPTLPSVSLSSLKESSSSDCFFSDSQLSHVVDGLSVMEIGKLRKRAYLRLSLLLEKYCNQPLISLNSEPDSAANFSAKNWTMQKFFKKMKNVEAKQMKEEGIVFGQTLDSIRQRSGHCLPRTILEILRYLRQIAPDTVGIFRKNGVKSRIAELRLLCDRETDTDLFVEENALTSAQVHDVADLLKQYLRELPEPLMTTKYSRTFANIHEYVPEEGRINATRDALLLLPDEHREALQTLLFFLADIAKHSSTNSMPAQNLSVCLTPSLFHLSASRLQTASPASRRHKTVGGTGMPSEAEMRETRAAQACLTTLITHATALFTLSNTARDATHAHTDIETPLLKSLGGQKGPRAYLQKKMEELVREHGERWRGWIVEGHSEGVELSSKGSYDEHPLQLFRAWTDVDAPPKEVLHRITRERYVWDSNLLNSRVMDSLLPDTELYQFVVNDSVGHPTRDCFVIRMQRTDMVEPRGAACLVERSVACSETQLLGGVGAAVLDSRYLIEPHQGRSRITLISRIDLRGRGPAWYTTHYHYILARQLKRLRLSFQQPADDGPETKV